jgi:hypothetical protein
MAAEMKPSDLPADIRERAQGVARELLRRRSKGFQAFALMLRIGNLMQRHIENRTLHTEEVLQFAEALAADKIADKGTAQ